jgi:hypothetical protein
MQADAHANGVALRPGVRVQRPGGLGGGGHGGGREGEGDEEGVALGINLHSAKRGPRLAQQRLMLAAQLGVALPAHLLQEAGAALDIGEEEGHRSGG